MAGTNGQTRKPAIAIFWNNEAQTYEYHPDPEQLRNNDMVQAVLGMCLEKAKFNTNLINMQAVQQQQMQAMQDQAIRSKLIH